MYIINCCQFCMLSDFQHLIIRLKNMSLLVEERLLLKLFSFVGYNTEDEQETANETDFETQRILAEATSANAKRYYFGSLKLIFCQVLFPLNILDIECNKMVYSTQESGKKFVTHFPSMPNSFLCYILKWQEFYDENLNHSHI